MEARNLHLTLHFLGEVDNGRLAPLTGALAPALDCDAPRLGVSGWSVFPPKGPARVIWIGVSAGAGALARAHDVLGERLRSAGLAPESRPFAPHLTVGRVKVPSGPLWERLTRAMPAGPVCEWVLRACTLMESRLSPAGPAYETILSIPFAGVMPPRAGGGD